MQKLRFKMLALAATAMVAGAAQANDHQGDWYIDGMGSGAIMDSGRNLDDGFAGLTGRFGKKLNDSWNVELSAQALDIDGDSAKGGTDFDQFSGAVNALWVFNRGGVFQPYLLGGLGMADSKFSGRSSDKSPFFDVGAGAIVPLADGKYRLRGEVVRRDEDTDGSPVDYILNIGLGVPFGKKAEPVVVAAVAAPIDSDGDGVTDDMDQCPGTPPGAIVDARGCELDSDGDGVVDRLDECPGTPKGVEVDEVGCPIVVVISLDGVNFRTNSADLLDGADIVLDEQAGKLVENATITIEVAGHTDSDGDAGYNQQLSQRRAETVRDYLIGKGVSADRISATGYGESEPIASNATREGKAMNRRVELRVQEDN